MSHHSDITGTARHARLFELIRQDNVISENDNIAPRSDTLELADLQQFLTLAEQSLRREDSEV